MPERQRHAKIANEMANRLKRSAGRTRAERGSKCVKCAGKVKSDGEALDLDLQG
jgi:hypothetical protein